MAGATMALLITALFATALSLVLWKGLRPGVMPQWGWIPTHGLPEKGNAAGSGRNIGADPEGSGGNQFSF